MSRYRRAKIEGGTFFFTITLADRSDDLLVRHVDRLRQAYKFTADRYPFETIAICILSDHLHAIWSLPTEDRNFSLRLGLIKSKFSVDFQVQICVPRVRLRNATKAFGNGVIGSTPFAMTTIWLGTSIPFTITRSSTDMFRRCRIGPTAVFIDMLNWNCCGPAGAAMFRLATLPESKPDVGPRGQRRKQVVQISQRLGRLCPPYGVFNYA
jgi:REP element-mobilizing transposase RayT